MVEQPAVNRFVPGSSPGRGALIRLSEYQTDWLTAIAGSLNSWRFAFIAFPEFRPGEPAEQREDV